MDEINIRQRLHEFIDTLEDRKAEAIYTLFIDEIDIEVKRKRLIQLEREKYIKGEEKSYSWNEVKEMAVNKASRHAI